MVGPGALHPAAAILDATPEVASAYHQAHLNAKRHAFLDNVADLADHLKIQAGMLLTGQRLAADLQQHALVHWFFHVSHPFAIKFHGSYTPRARTVISALFYRIFSFLHRG